MAGTESRTLEIVSRVKDFASRAFRRMGRTFQRVIRFSFLAPLRALRLSLRAMRAFLVGFSAAAISAFAFVRGGQTVSDVLSAADAMSKLARATDSTTESLSTLQTTFALGGLEAEQFRAVVLGMGRAISQSLRGTGQQLDAFTQLDISLAELRRGNYPDLFRQIAAGLEQFSDQSEKAALLQALFPDNFQRLLPLLGQGEEAFLANARAAQKFGAALGTEAGQAAERFNDEMLKLRTVLGDIARSAIVGVAREMTPMISALAEFARLNRGELIASLQALIRTLVHLATIIADTLLQLLVAFSRGVSGLVRDLREAAQAAGFLGGALLEGLATVLEAVFGEQLPAAALETQRQLDTVARAVIDLEAKIRDLGAAAPDQLRENLASLRGELDRLARKFAEAKAAAQGIPPGAEGEPRAGPDVAGARQRALDRARLQRLRGQLGRLPDFVRSFEGGAAEPLTRGGGGGGAEAVEGFQRSTQAAESFFSRFEEGMGKAIKRWTDFKQAAIDAGEQVVDRGLRAVSSGLADAILGVKSWGDAFRDIGRQIIETLVRIGTELLVVRSLQSLAGLGSSLGSSSSTKITGTAKLPHGGTMRLAAGGIVPAPVIATATAPSVLRAGSAAGRVPVHAYQAGGIADRPTFALFGEGAGEEAFVPLQQGRIPVRIRGQSGESFTFAPQIRAMDSRDVRRVLIDERHTLMAIWANEMQHRRGVRESMHQGTQ